MARYERDYEADFGRRGQGGPIGGMRSDGWGGSGRWRDFAGEEGWFGTGYPGTPDGGGYDRGFRGGGREPWDDPYRRGRGYEGGEYGPDAGRYGGHGLTGSRGYGGNAGYGGYGYGGRRDEFGHRGRDAGFMEGWRDEGRGGRPGGTERVRASQIMTDNPASVTPETSLSDVARRMKELDVGVIPVVDSTENRRLCGLITDRDIAVRAVAEGLDGSARVEECMTDEIRAVNKNDSVQDVMRLMREEQIRRVPVTDREGRLVGIIAQADLAVDYAAGGRERGTEVGETIERISAPARPRRGSNGHGWNADEEGED